MASGALITSSGMIDMQQVVAGTDVIEPADFNNARANVNRLLGDATDLTLGLLQVDSTWGYTQGGAGVNAAASSGLVYADNATGGFKRLQDDVQALCAFLGQPLRTGVGSDVTSSTGITADTWNNLMLNVKDCWDNRFTPASVSSSLDDTTDSGVISWTNTMTQISTWTFASESECRAFFNGGGRLGLDSTFSAASPDTQNTTWETRLSTVGTVYLGHDTSTAGVSTSGIGFYELTTSNQIIINYFGAAAPYSSDNYRVQARVNSITNPTQVIFTCTYIDADDNGIDANSYGTITVNARRQQPDASGSGFSFDVPTVAMGAFSGS